MMTSGLIATTGVENGAGCLLFVRDGVLSSLEGYTYVGEEWARNTRSSWSCGADSCFPSVRSMGYSRSMDDRARGGTRSKPRGLHPNLHQEGSKADSSSRNAVTPTRFESNRGKEC